MTKTILGPIFFFTTHKKFVSEKIVGSGSREMFGSKIILGRRKCWVQKKFVSKKLLGPKNILGPKETFGSSSIKGRLHKRPSCIKGRLPSKVFNQRSSSIRCCLPSKIVFHQSSSSIKGRLQSNLPSKVIISNTCQI